LINRVEWTSFYDIFIEDFEKKCDKKEEISNGFIRFKRLFEEFKGNLKDFLRFLL